MYPARGLDSDASAIELLIPVRDKLVNGDRCTVYGGRKVGFKN